MYFRMVLWSYLGLICTVAFQKKPCTEVAQSSKSLNVLLTKGKENQEIWPSSSPAGK